MLKETIDKAKYNKMLKNAVEYYYRDYDKDRIYILDSGVYLDDFKSKIDEKQIEWLNSLNGVIKKSELPFGIAYYQFEDKKTPVAVIYRSYSMLNKSFNSLYKENDDLVFHNLIESYYNNKELLDHGIYNVGFKFDNIMYNKKSVKLINLDGSNIQKEAKYSEVYKFYLKDLEKLFFNKLLLKYDSKEANRILMEYMSLFYDYTPSMSVDYPLEVINEMQRTLTLK